MERERRKITLASISQTTKIPIALLEGLEHDDLSRWPAGIFRRSFIRAYASGVGLDPEATALEFLEQHPHPAEADDPTVAQPPPVEGATRAFDVATMFQELARVQIRVADAGRAFMRGPLVPEVPRRWAAAACDVGVVVVIGVLLSVAFREFWMPFAVGTVGYYVASIIALGNTPGVSLFAGDPPRRDDRGGAAL